MQQKTTTHAGSHSDIHLHTCTVHAHVLSSRAVCMHACMHVFSSYIEHELVINKSSEDFLHACLGTCVYVVYLVLLRSPAASNDIDRDSVHQDSESPLRNFGMLHCELCRAVGHSLPIHRLYLGDIDYCHPEDVIYVLCVVPGLATLAMLLEPQWSGTNALFGGIARYARLGRPALRKHSYRGVLFATSNTPQD
jgi:hypothetical protein